jgi:hypothetical protein
MDCFEVSSNLIENDEMFADIVRRKNKRGAEVIKNALENDEEFQRLRTASIAYLQEHIGVEVTGGN